MKRNRLIQWLALLLTGALLLCFAACNNNKKPVEPPTEFFPESETYTEPPTVPTASTIGTWRIELRGIPSVLFFSSEDAQYLPKVQIPIPITNPETGLTVSYTFGGITLRSLLNFCGVQNVANVTVASLTGAAATYTDLLAMAEDTILAWEIDGALIDDDPPLRMCPKTGQASDFISKVSSINVTPAGAYDPGLVTDPYQPDQPTQPFSAPPMGVTDDYNRTTTTWPTYPPSVPGVDQPTTETTTTTTTRPPWTIPSRTSYAGRDTTAATTTGRPNWWPDDMEWPPR